MTTTHCYQADVTLRFRLLVESTDVDSAHAMAKQATLQRPGVRPEHVAGISVTQLSELGRREIANRHAWQEQQAVRERGTFEQFGRWVSCGDLPESELLQIAREELFRPFAPFAKRRQMVFADIAHPKDDSGIWKCLKVPICGRHTARTLADLVDWSTTPDPALTTGEQRVLLRLQQAAAEIQRHSWMQGSGHEAVSLKVREHSGTCKRCGESTFERSCLVTVQWAGRNLSREYVL